MPFNSIGTLRNLARVTNKFLASFGVFGSFFIIETSKEEGESCEINGDASWSSNTWRIQALEHFIALFQTNQRCKEEVQQIAVSHGYAKFHTPCQISHGMRNLHVHRLH